jgi:Protein of unknown function (DUF998)
MADNTIELSPFARIALWVAIAAAAITLILLALLHVLSPEFDPSWRMISEYAEGKFSWVLSLMFAVWAISSWALLVGIWRQEQRALFRAGLLFLFLAGLSEVLASAFDVNQPLHGLADMLSLGLPIAAMLITAVLSRSPGWSAAKRSLRLSANATWISVAVLAASFALAFLTFHLAGITMDPHAGPTAHAPAGVIGYMGLANRLLAVAYLAWVATIACQAIRLSSRK